MVILPWAWMMQPRCQWKLPAHPPLYRRNLRPQLHPQFLYHPQRPNKLKSLLVSRLLDFCCLVNREHLDPVFPTVPHLSPSSRVCLRLQKVQQEAQFKFLLLNVCSVSYLFTECHRVIFDLTPVIRKRCLGSTSHSIHCFGYCWLLLWVVLVSTLMVKWPNWLFHSSPPCSSVCLLREYWFHESWSSSKRVWTYGRKNCQVQRCPWGGWGKGGMSYHFLRPILDGSVDRNYKTLSPSWKTLLHSRPLAVNSRTVYFSPGLSNGDPHRVCQLTGLLFQTSWYR